MQNRATLTGYLGKDAVLGTTRNQTPFVTFSLATHRVWKDRKSGQRQSATTWHRCVVFGKLANYAGTLTKGAFVQLEGEIRTREYIPRVIADSARDLKKIDHRNPGVPYPEPQSAGSSRRVSRARLSGLPPRSSRAALAPASMQKNHAKH